MTVYTFDSICWGCYCYGGSFIVFEMGIGVNLRIRFIMIMFFFSHLALATNAKSVSSSQDPSQAIVHPVAPKVKKGEYALFLNDNYIVFKTQKTAEGFELDLSCYTKSSSKSKKPDCMAYAYAKMKAENVQIPHPAMNNRAAFHCSKMQGRNLLAIDDQRNEIDFCRFQDNSMVSSWSMYMYHNPLPVKK